MKKELPTEMLMQTREGKSSKSLWFSFYVVLQPVTKSSRSQIFFKIGVLKSFAKIHRKTPVPEKLGTEKLCYA